MGRTYGLLSSIGYGVFQNRPVSTYSSRRSFLQQSGKLGVEAWGDRWGLVLTSQPSFASPEFTDEELDFIPSTKLRTGINYDIKYRMGREADSDEG